ncbi:MAG: TolC family protein [Bdellovibrio sp.]|nr:TolC family protein [Bdellovibrio sp.]
MKSFYFLAPLLLSTSLHALTLQEAIKTSIDQSSKTAGNQLRVQAMEDRLKAQKVNWLPTASISIGSNISSSRFDSERFSQSSIGRSQSAALISSVTLYDGGANKFSTLAAEADLKAMKARFSSSNALIPYTRGSIASDTVDAYVGLLQVIEQKNYLNFLSATLKKYAPGFTGDDLVLIEQRINDLKTSNIRTDFNHSRALEDFDYFTTVPAPPPSQLDTIDQAINSLIIPASGEEAINIALEKNQNIKTAQYELESSEYSYQGGHARRTLPNVILQASISKAISDSNNTSGRSNNSNVGVYLNYPLDAKNSHFEAAALKNVEASKRELEVAVEEAKHSIKSIYPSLQNQLNLYRSQAANLKSATDSLNVILEKIRRGDFVDINVALNILSSHQMYTQQCLDLKISILYTRFKIQRTVGTLFDNLNDRSR